MNIILVVTHKQTKIKNDEFYRPIIVGMNNVTIENALRDNTGDNISGKNSTYCELTAIYWAWKNLGIEYNTVGICHYRRYFTKCGLNNSELFFLEEKDIEKYLQKNDIILPIKWKWHHTVGEIYYKYGNGFKKDLIVTRETIKALFPEYTKAFDRCINSREASYCNMFIMSRKNFNAYCTWLFEILCCVEKKVDISDYTTQQKRMIAYLPEILLNVWVRHNNLKVKYCDLAYTDISAGDQLKRHIKTKYLRSC